MRNDTDGRRSASVIIIVAAVLVLVISALGIIPFIFMQKMVNGAMDRGNDVVCDVPVTAVITEKRERRESVDDGTASGYAIVYTPVYEYEYKGKKYSVAANFSSSDMPYEVGDKAEIMISDTSPGNIYDPNFNAKKSFKEFQSHVSKAFFIMLALPVVLFIVILIAVLAAIKKSRKPADTGYGDNSQPFSDEYSDPNDDYRG